jgi:hypothetical protein
MSIIKYACIGYYNDDADDVFEITDARQMELFKAAINKCLNEYTEFQVYYH